MNVRSASVIFLPGVIMPCAPRYAALLRELDNDVGAVTKDLELYAGPGTPPDGYDIAARVAAVLRRHWSRALTIRRQG